MSQRNGGELLIEMLERAGVRQFFTLHGGHLDSVFMAARERGFAITDMRHEQAAVHAADGWARATGEPGIAVVTSGPGVANAVSGVVNAFVDAIPMLVIGGANPADEDERLPLAGGYDQVALMAPVTKWAHRIPKIERVPDLVAQAIRVATTGRPQASASRRTFGCPSERLGKTSTSPAPIQVGICSLDLLPAKCATASNPSFERRASNWFR